MVSDNLDCFTQQINKGKNVILFGSGKGCEYFLNSNIVNKSNICFIADNNSNKCPPRVNNIPIKDPNEIKAVDNRLIVITSIYVLEITRQLASMGVDLNEVFTGSFLISINEEKNQAKCIEDNMQKIKAVSEMLFDEESRFIFDTIINKRKNNDKYYYDVEEVKYHQYFPFDILSFFSEEVFVDVGVFNGVTSIEFSKKVVPNFKKIYAFEPDPANYKICLNNFEKCDWMNQKIELRNKALSNVNGYVRFSGGDSSTSSISDTGNIEVISVKLDDEISEKVTFIKMDIEGAEIEALKGAENIIKTYKPKLAISIYHKTEHLWEIPLLVKEFVPEYKMYVRHHSFIFSETVLYATL